MDTLEELRKQRAELDKKIEELEFEECHYKDGDEYYTVDIGGLVNRGTWDDFLFERRAFYQGNILPTKQEAELESERRKLLHRFKMFRDRCNGEWKNNFYIEQRHYYIDFYNSEDVLFTDSTFFKSFDLFGYFKNESDCDKAIELFGDEIKRLYVEV